MKNTSIASCASAIGLALVLAGCQKASEPPAPEASAPPAAAPAAPANTAAPPPSATPPSDTASKPDQAPVAGTSGDHSGAASQATPKDLSKAEEKAAMPLPGQANDHSTTTAPPGNSQNK